MLQLTEFAGACLETHLGIRLANLELLSLAYFIFVCFCKLGLGLLVPSVLFFIITDLIIKLFKIVLECDDFILSSSNRVFEAQNVLIPLILHFALVSNSVFSGLNLRLQALHRVLRRLV